MKTARNVFRMPGAETWNKEGMAKIWVRAARPNQPKEPEVVFRETEESKEEPQRMAFLARHVYIKPADIEKY